MLNSLLELVLRSLVECLLSLLWWFLLFPVVWLVSLPFILIMARFRRPPYGLAVTRMLTTVHCAWRDWGLFLTP